MKSHPYLIKCINQPDEKGNLSPEDTAYAISVYPGISHTLFHFTSLSFLSLWLLLNYQNIFTTYYNLLYLSKSTPSFFSRTDADSHIYKNHPGCSCLDFLNIRASFCAVFLCVLVLVSLRLQESPFLQGFTSYTQQLEVAQDIPFRVYNSSWSL